MNRGPIHVLYVIDELKCTLGGGERVLLNILKYLDRDRFRCSVLTFRLDRHAEYLREISCPLHVLSIRRTYDWRAPYLAMKFCRLLHAQRVHIVHTFFETSDIWAGTLTKLGSSARLIWSKRDMGILRKNKHRIAYRLLARIPDRVLAVSEEVRQFCISQDRLDPEKVETLYNGIEVPQIGASSREELRTQFGLSSTLPVAITVANVRRLKGIDVLLRAAAIVRKSIPQAVFFVVGAATEKDYFEELQQQMRQLDLEDNVKFIGAQKDVWRYLQMSDLFVLPSRSEGFSNALIEGMAAGLPCIASSVGGNREAIENGKNGFLFTSEDSGSLAERICMMLQRRDYAKEIGSAAAARARATFSCQAMMARLMTMYQNITLADTGY